MFLIRAGTIIFSVAVVVWALSYFPRMDSVDVISASSPASALSASRKEAAAAQLEQSFLGSLGKTIAPVFAPLGWDWKVSAAVIASFPAREVVIAVLGTIYAVGDDVTETDESLIGRIRESRHPDGSPVFTTAMAIGLMLFYAFCLQCASTIAIMRRETNTWRWPLFAWLYMSSLGYLAALLCFHIGS